MLPVVGPTLKIDVEPFADRIRNRYTQAMPVDRPLPYTMFYYFGRNVGGDYTGTFYDVKQADFGGFGYGRSPQLREFARNQCYADFVAKVSDRAGWAENLAQYNKTRKGIVDRCEQLFFFVQALKHHRFKDAARVLRTPQPSDVSHRKSVAQNFLEFEYGVKPLISDLQSSWVIITSDPGVRRITAQAREHYTDSTGSFTSTSSGSSKHRDVATVDLLCRMGGTVRVTNPDVFLANQLGVFDLALPWKLLPFSFVVDWFVNFEQCISSVSDFMGLLLESSYTTEFCRANSSIENFTTWIINPATGDFGWTGNTVTRSSVELQRQDLISGPTLMIKPFRGFSLQRGAQALSLVLAVFGK